MQDRTPSPTPAQSASAPQTPQVSPAYVPPVLTPLGAWKTLTLIVSVPIGPGGNGGWGGWN